MKAGSFALGSILIATATLPLAAQLPQLGSIEAPYPPIQTTVHVAGGTYNPGAVAYGQVGAPLVLTGSNLGTSGTVQFTPYSSTCLNQVAQNSEQCAAGARQATVTLWTSTMLILSVPANTVSGLVKVTTSGGTSNGLPFIATPGSYAPSCPVASDDSDFQIATSSLQDGTVGQSYSVTLGATGGLAPYTWASVGNALPSGLSLSSTGVISGTPTTATANSVSVTIQAQDSNHLVTQALLNLKVDSSLQTTGAVYSYSAIYDGVGNVSSYTDSVMGAWSFYYDTLNRLATGNATTGDYDGQYACWNYDSFGNRQQQVLSSAAFVSGGGNNACQAPSTASVATDLATYTNGNQIAVTNARGVVAAPGYDAAGDITSDGIVNYLYDAEGRVCAVAYTPTLGITSYYGYEYDAEGNRVAKGTITTTLSTWSCDPSLNGFSYTESYVLSPSGQQLTMLDGNGHWQRTNVYAGSALLATYDTTNLHFHLSDPLGTRRVQTDAAGHAETDCESLPFGDELTCFLAPNAPNTADDSTPLHFTGKERDAETGGLDGNDYFEARYYSSAIGRFMSPDWSSGPTAVPYADFANPQSLNLYSYAGNNPLVRIDANGHCWSWIQGVCNFFQRPLDWVAGNGFVTFSQARADKRAWVSRQVPTKADADWVMHQATWQQIKSMYYYYNDPHDQANVDALAKVGIQIIGSTVPRAALDTLASIQSTGQNLPNQAGGQPYRNDDGALPTQDANGKPITYQEWDIDAAKFQGKPRSADRVVTGSDGSAWYTSNHYQPGGWTQIQ